VLGSDHKPIAIGRLQRYAMDYAREHRSYPAVTAAPTGKSIAVIGAGPAGLSCAGELAMLGHAVTIFEKTKCPRAFHLWHHRAARTCGNCPGRDAHDRRMASRSKPG